MDEIIGHDNTKKQLIIASNAANKQNRSLPHALLAGVAGCGKTTMANSLARLNKVDFFQIPPDQIADRESILSVLNRLNHAGYNRKGDRIGKIKPTIVFIDEIHRIPRKGQEILGIAMEKFVLEGDKPDRLYWIPYFTLIGATTDDGELSKPFREKFKLRFVFCAYTENEVKSIIQYHADKRGILITAKAITAIAIRSRGIPRIAIKYLDFSKDHALSINKGVISSSSVEAAFTLLGVDSRGLAREEIRLLLILYHSKEPLGVDNLSIIINESQKNLKNTIEPFLIQEGLVIRSGKGRKITDEGRKYLEANNYVGNETQKSEIPTNYERK